MTGEGTPVRHMRVREGDQDGGPSKRVKKAPETEGTPGTELRDLLEEVLETNWLLRQLWQTAVDERQEMHGMAQAVEGVLQEVRSIAQEMERSELQRELEDLRDDQSGYYETSGKDSESTGSWRTGSDDPEERSLEKWRTSAEPESEDLVESWESEGEDEVEQEEVEGDNEADVVA